MGRSLMAPEVFNCSAPDTGNMETILRYGTEAQNARWLAPLMAGEIRSPFAMTEPAVASSDETHNRSSIIRYVDNYLIQEPKWYTNGATVPRSQLNTFIVTATPE